LIAKASAIGEFVPGYEANGWFGIAAQTASLRLSEPDR
jgi:hypothetical protein